MEHDKQLLGGYSDVARHITAVTGRQISRQQVYMWHLRRAGNGFPESLPGYARQVFSLKEAADWAVRYWSTRLQAEAAGVVR